MASLFDLLQSGQLQTGSADLQDPIEQLKALLAQQQGGDTAAMPGVSVSQPSFGSLSPMQTAEVPPRAAPGIPYDQMPAPQTGYDPLARIDEGQPKPAQATASQAPGGLPLGEKVMSFLSGLSGEGGLRTMMGADKTRETENLTAKTLIDRGIASSPEEAKAIARNPAALQAALVQIFSPKGFNLKADEKRFMPGATAGAPAIEVASGADKRTIIPQGAKVLEGGRIVAENAQRAPPGYQWKDPGDPTQGSVPIPGGPADEKFQATQRSDKTALDATIANISQAQKEAKDLISHEGLGGNFGVKGMFWNPPGFSGASADAGLKQFRARAGFQSLQAMRAASKTGGALGNVSNQEGQRLENAAAALDKAQSVDDAKARLQTYIDEAEGAKDRAIAAYRRAYGEADPRMAPQGKGASGWRDLGGGVRIREKP